MRKLAAAVAIAGVMLGGWAQPGAEPQPQPPSGDVLFLRTGRGITLIRTNTEEIAQRFPNAVPSVDWTAVVRAVPVVGANPHGTETRVISLDLDAHELWSQDIRGTLEVKVASAGGRLAALGPPSGSAGYPEGRSSTPLVIAGDPAGPTTIELRGNYEPEAFSTDGESLFVVQYLPPLRPSHYRVRRLDLQTEQVTGVFTVDGHLQEAMQGTARIQAASPDGRRLYTLYTLEGPDGVRRAFVHVLSLDELWAHCVDLPDSFSTARERAIAIAVAPDGERVYVADATSGTVAEIDTEALAVARTARVSFNAPGGAAQAVSGGDGTLYLAKGARLVFLDTRTMSIARSRDMRQWITGLQAGAVGSRLYVGQTDHIAVLNTATGLKMGELDADGVIDQLGRSTRWLAEERTAFTCAC